MMAPMRDIERAKETGDRGYWGITLKPVPRYDLNNAAVQGHG
jgi:hypothetical protein